MKAKVKKIKLKEIKPKKWFSYVIAVGIAGTLVAALLVLSSAWGSTRPQLKIVEITYSKCSDCFNLSPTVERIKLLNATIESLEKIDFESTEARELIAKYNIKKIPTLIVRGDTTKTLELKETWAFLGEVADDGTVVLTKISPVYVDVSSGEIQGRVKAIHILDPECKRCRNYTYFIKQLADAGMRIVEEKFLNYSEGEGANLTKAYNITKVPSLILSRDASKYAAIAVYLSTVGSFEKDDSFILRENEPPYNDLSVREIVGLVHIVNIVDESCGECYNVSLVREFFEKNFGIVFEKERTYYLNSTEGRNLVWTYNVTKVPTSLLSWVAQLYTALRRAWPRLGTIETFGYETWLVFRNIDALGGNLSYKELFLNRTER